MAWDPVRDRLVVYGGSVHPGEWQPIDDVIAFDPATRRWIAVVPPSAGD